MHAVAGASGGAMEDGESDAEAVLGGCSGIVEEGGGGGVRLGSEIFRGLAEGAKEFGAAVAYGFLKIRCFEPAVDGAAVEAHGGSGLGDGDALRKREGGWDWREVSCARMEGSDGLDMIFRHYSSTEEKAGRDKFRGFPFVLRGLQMWREA